MNQALYLSQSYQDAWDDYERSLQSGRFPVWDDVVLTASDEHQAEAFRKQIAHRKAYLPARTRFFVIPDEGNVRVGSGGATLSVLKYLREREDSFENRRILVIHSGGDSRRVPQYSALGKLFSPVPRVLPDGRSATLFDEYIIAVSAIPGRIREGMLLLSGDVLLLFNPLLIDYSGRGAACISFKEDAETGKNHGVFLRGDDGYVRSFLHKQSVETLRKAGAVNDAGAVDIDIGALIFGPDVLDALYTLISTDGSFDEKKYRALVNEHVRLSLYGDFQYPLATDATREQYFQEAAEGEDTPALRAAREQVWEVLSPFRLKLLRLAPAKFVHFGTTAEILKLVTEDIGEYADLGWSSSVNCATDNRTAGCNAVLSPQAEIGEGCYLEVSYVHGGAVVGAGSILSCVDLKAGFTVPPDVVLHGLKQNDGRFVCRIYGVHDNPKEDRLFGKTLDGDLWEDGEDRVLWNARLYPVCATIDEAVGEALLLYETMTGGGTIATDSRTERKSLAQGFHDADPGAILAWSSRMSALVKMNDVDRMIRDRVPVKQVPRMSPLGSVQRLWLQERLAQADYGERMRLHFYIGTALGGSDGENEIASAFGALRSAVLDETLSGLRVKKDARIRTEEHAVSLPLRVNWGGGWSDTPPYCNENGGTVLNAAVLLGDERPVRVRLKKLEEHRIVFESRDMDVYGAFDTIEPLQAVGDPYDPYVLQKAALLACGVIPAQGGSLGEVLARIGGGFRMSTEVVGVPKGSGLGTSSILAAACVKALFEFLDIPHTVDDLYGHVLCMEQIMSTGGGWQDQVGGVTDGIKYITSTPGLKQTIRVEHVVTPAKEELDRRFCLIYTGQRRLARNLLRDVIGRYIGNEPDTVFALNEIQKIAALMKFELQRGHVDDFARLLSEHWELSKMIDRGSTNTLIDQIFDSLNDLLAGKMICGAGGGGFLQAILKPDASRTDVQNRLKHVFQDTDIRLWNCRLADGSAEGDGSVR